MNETIYDRIMRHEGLRLKPYFDTTGNPTIGYGHKITAEQGVSMSTITKETAEHLLYADVALARKRVADLFPWSSKLDHLRQEILAEMAFQLGAEGLLGFHDFLFHVNSGDYASAAGDMIHSQWHAQTPERCEELAAIMLEG